MPTTWTISTLRQAYLDFFAERGHAVIPSAPLVPDNDPTTLFTSSGMQPLVPYLLGQPHPQGNRLVDSQKSFRAVDIEDVGDNRHTTFFEMLGNWSLGDYFKTEQLRWFFEFLTQVVGIEPQRLFVTVYSGNSQFHIPKDDEAVRIWQELFAEHGMVAPVIEQPEVEGLQVNGSGEWGRIFVFGDAKNWWSRSGKPEGMPAGEPGGPDSEVFYDFGAELELHQQSEWADQPCHVNCDCGRFMEIGNSVFMQYLKQADGGFAELPHKNVDFGGGLERILAASQGLQDVFLTSAFTPLMNQLERLAGVEYAAAPETTKRSLRVMADHIRAAVLLAADGVLPSNKEQGYFARRLLRRAIRYAKMLNIEQHFLADSVPAVVEIYAEAYPAVAQRQTVIEQAFAAEEQKFHQALRRGLREIEKHPQLTEAVAFQLYETYGFPFELTQELAAEQGAKLDPNIFAQLRQDHASQSRTASAGKFKGGLADHSETTVKYHTATHLLHAALRQVLGDQVQQKGSNITQERLRFDFSFDRALTDAEKTQVQQLINDWIAADLPVHQQMLPKSDALKSGAIAFFDNYPDEVSVYTIGPNPAGPAHQPTGWISKELCGGPHVDQTGQIGPVLLTKEQSAGAGVRRVYVEMD